jgi:hypothetical protein
VLLSLSLALAMGACSEGNGQPDGNDLADVEEPTDDPNGWCTGYQPPPAGTETDCRSDADCTDPAGSCWAVGDTSPFYSMGICPRECATDPDCSQGQVCVTINQSECGQCLPACAAGGCNRWEHCGDDGHCRPASCEGEGYTCPVQASCAPASLQADEHGCVNAHCTSDGDCGCGACVLGFCQDGPGRCEPMRA